jgi:hypothetical protein
MQLASGKSRADRGSHRGAKKREVEEMIMLLAIVVVAVCAPLAAVVMVSLASRREDSARSLSSGPSGVLEAAGRRLVGFHGDSTARRSVSRGGAGARRGYLDDYGYLAGTGLNGTGLNGTGLNGTGLHDSGFLADQPDVPHLVG